jgi:hypothetical protein|tara:strand:- start:164 stop:592 length:429 start_codon:yes stop_codon:yes gene_type:complete
MTVASHQKLQDVVRKRFSDEFSDEYIVCYDNAPFEQPDDEMWVRWSVTTGESFRADIGASTSRNRHTGVAIAQIFTVLGKGTRESLILADRIVSKFRSVTDTVSVSGNSVVFKTPSVTTVGRSGSQWWQINVSCPYYADEIA